MKDGVIHWNKSLKARFTIFQRDPEEDEKFVLAFCDEETREGRAMFKLLQKLANENSEHAGTLEIVLIDPGNSKC